MTLDSGFPSGMKDFLALAEVPSSPTVTFPGSIKYFGLEGDTQGSKCACRNRNLLPIAYFTIDVMRAERTGFAIRLDRRTRPLLAGV